MPNFQSSTRYRVALAIDKHLGPALCAGLYAGKRILRRPQALPAPDQVRRILLVKMWGMGSIVLASSLLREIRRTYPAAEIHFLSLRENLPILNLCRGIDRSVTIDLSRGIPFFLLDTIRTLRALRSERYDLLLDLEFFTRFSAILSLLAKARRSHGFSTRNQWRGRLHDVPVPFNAYHHVTENFHTLLRGNPMDPSRQDLLTREDALPPLLPPAGSWESVAGKLSRAAAWRDGRPLVAVNPNTGDMAIERRWPKERMCEFLRLLVESEDVNIVLTGSPAERPYVESVVSSSGVGARLISLAGLLTIDELVALYAHADLVVTNDSGPLHIACAAGAPTVSLFGPETPTLYGPLASRAGQRHLIHYRGLGCSPCMFVHDNKVLTCWFAQAECMTGIRPAEVLDSARKLLRDSAPSSRRDDA